MVKSTDNTFYDIVISLLNKAISVNISDNGSTANIGRNFSLSCLIFGHENLANISVQYQWLRSDSALDDNSSILQYNSSILTFPSLNLSYAGCYTCIVTINSTYLLNQLVSNGSYKLALRSELHTLTLLLCT